MRLRIMSIVVGLLVPFLALPGCSQTDTPRVYPAAGAPLTAAIDGRTLIMTNNTDQSVYIRVFPTDILPAIEWAPCLAPEVCPAEQRIDPGQEKRMAVKLIARDKTESITVFWWIYLERIPGASIPPMEMDEFVLPLP